MNAPVPMPLFSPWSEKSSELKNRGLTQETMVKGTDNNRGLSGRLWREVRPYWAHLAAVLLLGLLSAPLALLAPLPLKLVVDNVIGTHPLPKLLDVVVPANIARTPSTVLALAVSLVVGVAL